MARDSFFYFIGYAVIVTVFYVLFAMPLSYIRHFTIGPSHAEALQVVELVEVDGKYVPWEIVQSPSSGISYYKTVDASGRGYSTYNVSRTQTLSGGGESDQRYSSTGSGRQSSDESDGMGAAATMYGSLSPRKSYKINTKASGGLPRLQEDAENEGKEEEEEVGVGDDCTEKKGDTAAVDRAYDRV
jgi:hypothetical protein